MFDRILFATVLTLTFFGLVMVYSAGTAMGSGTGWGSDPSNLFGRQCVAAVLGLIGMLAVMHVDYRLLRRPLWAYPIVVGALFLLTVALFAPSLNNTRRWLFVGGVSIQPSALCKLALVVFIAYQIDRKEDRIHSYDFLVPVSYVTLLAATLIVVGGDLGTAVVLCLNILLMIVLAGVSVRYLLIGVGVLLPLLAIAILSLSYRLTRWATFLFPEADPMGYGFQTLQALIAIGSGGLFGLGPGSSIQKLYYLPSAHADFIFAVVAEELGFVGALAVLGLFGLLWWRGALAGLRAPDTLGRYLAWGFTSLLVVQALLHVSVNLAFLPVAGLPLPLVSHGGSTLVVALVASGVILNVSRHSAV